LDNIDGVKPAPIRSGQRVQIAQKQDQLCGKLTKGVAQNILTNSTSPPARHPTRDNVKVRLTSGQVGRVKQIMKKGT
jgi:uncharacterized repeat protein (TIGR03833 family)